MRVGGLRRSDVIKLLTLLNYHFSLRDLQSMLGIPYQTLWRYVSLKCMPEERTGRRILERIEELKLMDKVLDAAVREALKDPYDLVRKPGFLALFTLMVKDAVRDTRVGAVIPMSEYAMMPATAIALELHCEVCPALPHHPLRGRRAYQTTHYSTPSGSLAVAVPKHCLRDKGKAVLVDVVLSERDKVEAFLGLLRSSRVEARCAAAVVMSDDIASLLNEAGVKHVRIATPHQPSGTA